jgi:LacI family transcriptional regulator
MNVNLYENFKRIGLIGMGMSGLDVDIRRGIQQYRGAARKWLFSDLGHRGDEVIRTLEQTAPGRACDGYIGHVGNEEVADRLAATGKPVVNLSGAYHCPEWATHVIDGEAIGRMAGEYYLSMGHRNFIFFGPDDLNFSVIRMRGFFNAVREHADLLIWIWGKKMEMWVPERKTVPFSSQVEQILKLPKPLAGFCAWDQHAVALCDFIHFQIHVPEELALLGVDNNEVVCGMSVVPMSSIALPAERLGYLAAEHLDCLLEGRPVPELQVLQPERVVVRASTDLVAMEDPIVAKALALMRHHTADRTTIEEIADKLPISRRGFTDRFKAAVGRTAREELFRLRVELAKERLLTTNQTMYQIAVECGFTDPESLAKHFRKWAGTSPSGFRKEHRV